MISMRGIRNGCEDTRQTLSTNDTMPPTLYYFLVLPHLALFCSHPISCENSNAFSLSSKFFEISKRELNVW